MQNNSYTYHRRLTTTMKPCRKLQGRGRPGFTLLEMLIVLAIIVLLLALTVTAVQRARAAAAQVECAHRMRQMALAVHQFHAAHQKLPEGCGYPFLQTEDDLTMQGGLSWQTAILPFIDQGPLWDEAWLAQEQDPITNTSPLHRLVCETVMVSFLCPAEFIRMGENSASGLKWGTTSYLGVAGTDKRLDDGVFHKDFTVRFADITDGSSNTLMIGERPVGPGGRYSAWYAGWTDCVCSLNQILAAGDGVWDPDNSGCRVTTALFRPGLLGNICDVNHFWSLHSGGANFAFADGSVRFLPYSGATIIPALATRAGGEIASLD
jgi:prepilin-type N-terminal cleavage/methylation domain-containing protein/prepilin-type processing-associated H-X9-DG protein